MSRKDDTFWSKFVAMFLAKQGFQPSLSGTGYLRDAIVVVLLTECTMQQCYEAIAEAHETSAFCVERSIRYAIATVYRNSDVYLTNKQFVCSVCRRLSIILD